jgi:hypothetical protein
VTLMKSDMGVGTREVKLKMITNSIKIENLKNYLKIQNFKNFSIQHDSSDEETPVVFDRRRLSRVEMDSIEDSMDFLNLKNKEKILNEIGKIRKLY